MLKSLLYDSDAVKILLVLFLKIIHKENSFVKDMQAYKYIFYLRL